MAPSKSVSRFFQSIMVRTLSLVAGSVLLAMLIVWGIWQAEWRRESEAALSEIASNMALRVSATVQYFTSLPKQYRHIVLEQLREMRGGSYFVTLNREFIDIEPLSENTHQQLVVDSFQQVLDQNTSIRGKIHIQFSDPRTLHVFNNATLLKDLPNYWDSHTQLLHPYNLPVLVIQLPISDNEWLYIATVIPNSLLLGPKYQTDRTFRIFGLVLLFFLLLLTVLKVQEIVRPFANLAKAASAFGRDLKPVPLPERGSREVIETIHAFNQMQDSIQQYMNERKVLFSGISHDLKTPLTRLRLRVAMMDENEQQQAIEKDLDYLELMVKSALQTMKDTDIHENTTSVCLNELLASIASSYPNAEHKVLLDNASFNGDNAIIKGKPLALRRCLENVIDNAIHYGTCATISLEAVDNCWVVQIADNGPGLPAGMEKEVFKPYLRLAHGRKQNPEGNGLGLMTARHLARIHGGELILKNRPEGGLLASVAFLRTDSL